MDNQRNNPVPSFENVFTMVGTAMVISEVSLKRNGKYEIHFNMSNNTYFLKITGKIHLGKQTEFQQTIQFIFQRLPEGCLEHDLARDVFRLNVFHLFSMWNSREALAVFRSSNECSMLRGSFQTLGVYEHTTTGRLADIQMFESIDVDKEN
jgi:quinol monooxygenase YgiN